MKFNKFLTLIMVLVLSIVLAACSEDDTKESDTSEGSSETNTESTETTTSSEPKELNVVFSSEPPAIHPGKATDTTSSTVIQGIFEGLMTMKDGKPVEAAAESYEISDDLLTYTFKLRDAQWTNGDPVTAEDFAYSWKWVLDPANASEYATILYPIKGAEAYNTGTGGTADDLGIKVIDEKTIEVTLEVPTPYFLELTAFKTMYPFHKATQEANENWNTEADTIVSNGPFTLTDWVHNGSLVLTKSDTYWDKDNVKLDAINIEIVESESAQMIKFDNDEIDFLGVNFGKVPLDALNRLKSDGSLNIAPYSGVYKYKFNTTDKVMKNVNIRKALALAIDRQSLIDNITKAEEEPALGIVPNAVEGFGNDEGYFKDADFETAKEYLAKGLQELGLSDPSELEVTISHNTSESHAAIAQFIQQGWTSQLGIKVKVDNAEWQVYLELLNNLDYQIGRLGWIADYNDAYTFLEMYNSADNGNNDTGWENPKFAELLKQSVSEADPAKRTAILLEAETIMMDEMPVSPIYFYTNPYVVKDYVSGMVPDGLGNISLKDIDVNK